MRSPVTTRSSMSSEHPTIDEAAIAASRSRARSIPAATTGASSPEASTAVTMSTFCTD